MKKKRVLALLMVACMLFALLSACGTDGPTADAPATDAADSDDADDASDDAAGAEGTDTSGDVYGEIEVWSFLPQGEVDMYIELYNTINPNVTATHISIPGDQFMTRVTTALRSGVNTPDVMLIADNMLGQLRDTDFLANLSEAPFNAEVYAAEQVPYVAYFSRDSEGNLRGLSYQSTPGGFWFRKDLAREYLGTDDSEEISEMISTWDRMANVAAEVHARSDGRISLLDSVSGVTGQLVNQRTEAFVDADYNLLPLSFFEDVFATLQLLAEHHADSGLGAWTPAWGAAMYHEESFILLGLPSWGLHFVIKANTPEDATDTYNTWGFARSPVGYRAGGTWAAIYANTPNMDAAWDFTRTITVDQEYLLMYVERTGDMVGHIPTIETIIESGFRDSFLGDQDIYSYLFESAMRVPSLPMTRFDEAIGDAIGAQAALVIDGQISPREAAENLGDSVQNMFPEINIVQ